MICFYKDFFSEGTLQLDKDLIANFNDFPEHFPPDAETDQLKLEVENLSQILQSGVLDYDEIQFRLQKILNYVSDDFSQEYFNIFIEFDLFDSLIKLIVNFENIQCQIFSIWIIANAISFTKEIIFPPELICDSNFFLKIMTFPFEVNSNSLSRLDPLKLWSCYSTMLANSFIVSNELVKDFYESGVYNLFIDQCLSLDKIQYGSISYWSDTIIYLSKTKFPIPIEDQMKLLPLFSIVKDIRDFHTFIFAVDNFIDGANDELLHLILNSSIYTDLIDIIQAINDQSDEELRNDQSEDLKVAMYALYKLIHRDDEQHLCDLTLLPISKFCDIIKQDNIPNRIASLQLLAIYLKNETTEFEIVDEFINKGIYSNLISMIPNMTYSTKTITTDFLTLSCIKANHDQLVQMDQNQIFGEIFENFEVTKPDSIQLLSQLLEKLIHFEEFDYLIQNIEALSKIYDDLDEDTINEDIPSIRIVDELNKS